MSWEFECLMTYEFLVVFSRTALSQEDSSGRPAAIRHSTAVPSLLWLAARFKWCHWVLLCSQQNALNLFINQNEDKGWLRNDANTTEVAFSTELQDRHQPSNIYTSYRVGREQGSKSLGCRFESEDGMRWEIPLMQRTTVGMSPERKNPTHELKGYTGYAFSAQTVVESNIKVPRKAQCLVQLHRASRDVSNFSLVSLQTLMEPICRLAQRSFKSFIILGLKADVNELQSSSHSGAREMV